MATINQKSLVTVSHCDETFKISCRRESWRREIQNLSSQSVTATRHLKSLVAVNHGDEKFKIPRHSQSLRRDF